jgi:hypothetical protein
MRGADLCGAGAEVLDDDAPVVPDLVILRIARGHARDLRNALRKPRGPGVASIEPPEHDVVDGPRSTRDAAIT